MKLRITTPYGDTYIVNEKRQISQYGSMKPSDGWIFVGLEHVKHNELITYETIMKRLSKGERIETCWKNGNPQYTVRDIDHGTTRTWGNTKYHGVRSIQLED